MFHHPMIDYVNMEYVWFLEKSLFQDQAHVDPSISLGNGMA